MDWKELMVRLGRVSTQEKPDQNRYFFRTPACAQQYFRLLQRYMPAEKSSQVQWEDGSVIIQNATFCWQDWLTFFNQVRCWPNPCE